MKCVFITGTDTDCGKTYVTTQLMQYYKQQGFKVLGMKPVASGCFERDGRLVNDDALAIQNSCSIELPYDVINPFALTQPVSPHIAAAWDGVSITIEDIIKSIEQIKKYSPDILFIEGAGGINVPINENHSWLDFMQQSRIPVLLVIGVKLGCINHSLLSEYFLLNHGIDYSGWVASQLNPDMNAYSENITTLKNLLKHKRYNELKYGEIFNSDVIELFDKSPA